jgi:hypothetical protein
MRPSTRHDLPATHHNFTTKNHTQNTLFLENPQQKRHSTTPKKLTPKNPPQTPLPLPNDPNHPRPH